MKYTKEQKLLLSLCKKAKDSKEPQSIDELVKHHDLSVKLNNLQKSIAKNFANMLIRLMRKFHSRFKDRLTVCRYLGSYEFEPTVIYESFVRQVFLKDLNSLIEKIIPNKNCSFWKYMIFWEDNTIKFYIDDCSTVLIAKLKNGIVKKVVMNCKMRNSDFFTDLIIYKKDKFLYTELIHYSYEINQFHDLIDCLIENIDKIEYETSN